MLQLRAQPEQFRTYISRPSGPNVFAGTYPMLFEQSSSATVLSISRETLRRIPTLAPLAQRVDAGVRAALNATRQLLADTEGHDDYHLDRRQWQAIAANLEKLKPHVDRRARALAGLAASVDARSSLKRTNRAGFIG